MKLPLPAVVAINQMINRVLALDPERVSKLSALSGKVVRIDVTGLNLQVAVIFLDEAVEVTGFFDGEVDTVLSGSPLDLLSLARDTEALFNGKVTIEGDSATGKNLKKLVSSLDIDWEEQFSSIAGDTVAHQVFRFGDNLKKAFSRSLGNLQLDAGEYLQEESLSLAPNSEVRHFCTDVDQLRADLDRLEAKLLLMEASMQATSEETSQVAAASSTSAKASSS